MNRQANIEVHYADHLAIRQLIDYYNDVVNRRDWGALPTIFARNATWEALAPINIKLAGLDSIQSGLPKSVARMAVLLQSSSGIIIDVRNDHEAVARSLMSEFGRPVTDGDGFHATGFYHDELVKEDGEWKFLSRKLELKYFDNLPVPGGVDKFKY